ncbi:MAG TPA: DHA2 family efflux MFS transporter permease subunit [Syntrophomonadaceae bacterium]|nr:DHA2 family efflux MFS transporter permease subunit [Syntrophomonadaceae bacterium]
MSDIAPNSLNPYLVSTAVSLAAFMEVLDTTIANVSLAHIAGSLGASTEESTWVLTTYLISNVIVLALSGWLSALLGRKNFFICCIIGFTIMSFMCGISTSLPMLILFRLLQGLAGGGLQPVQQAIIKDSFPQEKLGMALAITGITTVLAPVLGPVLGGYITDNYSWRWIFFMNVPVGILSTFLVKIFVLDPPSAKKQKTISIDYIGLGLIVMGLGALQIVLDRGQQEDWFSSSFIVFFACVSAVGLILAVAWLLKQKNPLIDLKLFKIPSFSMPCIMLFFIGFGLYASSVLLPMLVQEDFGYNATLAGLVLAPAEIVIILALPLVGSLVTRVQARYLISFGMLATALGVWATGLVTPQTDYNTFVFVRCLQTVGLPFLFVPAGTLAFSKISSENSSNASAIISLMRNLGGSIGIALVTNKLIHSQQIQQAYLVQHLTTADPGYRSALLNGTQVITNLGIPSYQASTTAMGKIYQELLHQSSILAFRDAHNFVAILLVVLGITALFMPSNDPQEKAGEGLAH